MKKFKNFNWEQTGLLEGIDVSDRSALILGFEYCVDELMNPIQNYDKRLESVLLPIVRRIFGELSENRYLSIDDFDVEDILIYCDENMPEAQDLHIFGAHIDLEAEMCDRLCREYVDKIFYSIYEKRENGK